MIKRSIDKYNVDELNTLEEFKPDIMIHPSFQGVYINELALICNRNDIPFILLMNLIILVLKIHI